VWQFLHWALYRLKPRATSPPPELVELLLLLELDEVLPDELLELVELLVLEELLLELDELFLPEDELVLALPAELDELDVELELFTGSPEQPDSNAAASPTNKNLSIIEPLQTYSIDNHLT
jgi:hypothetical protein